MFIYWKKKRGPLISIALCFSIYYPLLPLNFYFGGMGFLCYLTLLMTRVQLVFQNLRFFTYYYYYDSNFNEDKKEKDYVFNRPKGKGYLIK